MPRYHFWTFFFPLQPAIDIFKFIDIFSGMAGCLNYLGAKHCAAPQVLLANTSHSCQLDYSSALGATGHSDPSLSHTHGEGDRVEGVKAMKKIRSAVFVHLL